MLAEEGCIEYGATIDAQGIPGIEGQLRAQALSWSSRNGKRWHICRRMQLHHMKAHSEKTKEFTESKLKIHVLEPV